jgi:hypothetical protein
MDEELLKPEAGIVDPETMTLRPLKRGGTYTLLPQENDYKVVVLKRVREAYVRTTQEGCNLCSQWFHRMDELMVRVNAMFKSIEFYLVENADDMQKLIMPPSDPEWEAKKVEHNVLEDLLGEAEAKELLAIDVKSVIKGESESDESSDTD